LRKSQSTRVVILSTWDLLDERKAAQEEFDVIRPVPKISIESTGIPTTESHSNLHDVLLNRLAKEIHGPFGTYLCVLHRESPQLDEGRVVCIGEEPRAFHWSSTTQLFQSSLTCSSIKVHSRIEDRLPSYVASTNYRPPTVFNNHV
jgi:hypothetical protein